ncbi:hypothetical protein NGB58_26450 [Escherichia coli]|nr:hypothetical protein [Escherichia coli]
MKRRQLKKYIRRETERFEKESKPELPDRDTLMHLCAYRIALETLTAEAVAWRTPVTGEEIFPFVITRHPAIVKAWKRAGRHVEPLCIIPEMTICQGDRSFLEVFLRKEIEEMDEIKSDIPFGLSEEGEARHQSYRIALMTLTSEPKAWLHCSERFPFPAVTQSPDVAQSWKRNGFQVTPLYSLPDRLSS